MCGSKNVKKNYIPVRIADSIKKVLEHHFPSTLERATGTRSSSA